MEKEVKESELWKNYKSMADNLLSLTASLPVPLKHRAIDDLKKRLPSGDNIKTSFSSAEEEHADKPPNRKRGRPPKKSKQEAVAEKKSDLLVEKANSSKLSDFVIRTRHQRHVEQFGEQGVSEHGYRSPIVALLKSRSKRCTADTEPKAPDGCRSGRKHPSKKLQNFKRTSKRDVEKTAISERPCKSRKVKHPPEVIESALEQDKKNTSLLNVTGSSEIKQGFDSTAEKSEDENRVESGSSQQDQVNSSISSEDAGQPKAVISSSSCPVDEEQSPGTDSSKLPKCDVVNESNCIEQIDSGSLQASAESKFEVEAKQVLVECKPSQVILKHVQSMLPSGDGGSELLQEEFHESVTGEVSVFPEKDSNTSPQTDEIRVTTQRGRPGRKQKTTVDYKCPECPKMLRSRDILREHLKTHRSHYKCETCGRKFVFRFKYEAHRQVHESGNFHKCPHCANMVMGRDRLEQHIHMRHPGLEIPELCMQINNENNAPMAENTPGDTSAADETFSVDQSSQESVDHKPDAWPMTQSPKRASYASEKQTIQRRKMNHVCYECKQVFRSSKKLQIHQKTAHSRVASPCYICSRRFLYRASYDEHMDDHKKGLLKQCTFDGCTFYYKTERELQQHNDRIHNKSAPRPHVCQICSRSFWEARYLKQHMQSHDKSKMYVCEMCNFVSYNLMSLRRHLVNHHEMKLAHVCDLCGAKLCSKNTLHDHIKRHLNQKTVICEICSKAFINRSQLAMHMRIHKNPRYACSICGKKSRTGNKLLSHMLIHTKEKPYACLVEYCNYRCRVKSNLYKHMERVHKVQHPDKYKNYHYVEQLNNCSVEMVDNVESQAETTAENSSVTVTDVLYVCAFSDCNYQALTQQDVTKHQTQVHATLSDAQVSDTLSSDETSLNLSELPMDQSLECGVDVPETFESITIPVPVEEISDQTEAAHTLAQLQTASVVKDDVEQDLSQAYEENLASIKKEPGSHISDPLTELDPSHEEDSKPIPYPKLDDVLTHADCPDIEEVKQDITLAECSQNISASGIEVDGDNSSKTVYIVHVDDQEAATANFVELFAKSNVINFEPGTILVNEQGSVVSVIK